MDKQLAILTPEHPRWWEFAERLEGPEGCNFTADYDDDGEIIGDSIKWRCKAGTDKTYATAILETMAGIDVCETLLYFERNGGHCDCEILFNVSPDSELDN